jgi:hypothetical protein
MALAPERNPSRESAIPELSFEVEDAGVLKHAAVPTLAFELEIAAPEGVEVRSVMLNVQLQIAARRRPYDELAQRRLAEVFGTPDRWGSTLRTLQWLRTTLVVPPFTGVTSVELPVTLTYDLEVVASRYFHALADGKVPLEFLFSGSLFYSGAGGELQTTRLTWESEAEFELPVATWKAAMDCYFPGAAWLRLEKDSFDRLYDYKAERSLPTWEATLDSLLEASGD